MTLWICIGVYVVVMVAMPYVLSLVDGQPWATRLQPAGDDIGMFVTLLLWPIVFILSLIRMWACFTSEAGERTYKGIMNGLDTLKEALDD